MKLSFSTKRKWVSHTKWASHPCHPQYMRTGIKRESDIEGITLGNVLHTVNIERRSVQKSACVSLYTPSTPIFMVHFRPYRQILKTYKDPYPRFIFPDRFTRWTFSRRFQNFLADSSNPLVDPAQICSSFAEARLACSKRAQALAVRASGAHIIHLQRPCKAMEEYLPNVKQWEPSTLSKSQLILPGAGRAIWLLITAIWTENSRSRLAVAGRVDQQ